MVRQGEERVPAGGAGQRGGEAASHWGQLVGRVGEFVGRGGVGGARRATTRIKEEKKSRERAKPG